MIGLSSFRRAVAAASLSLAIIWAAGSAAACRMALVLALDVSSSVDDREDRLQRTGLAAALVSPQVMAAILAQPAYPVALHVFEWSGRNQQTTLLDWTFLTDRATIVAAAAAIAESNRRQSAFPTALGYALGHAASVLSTAPRCERHTVDVSGDGKNNAGFPPDAAYRHFAFGGVTVNALAIGGEGDDLSGYYRREVIRGPGAFVEVALDYNDFQRAMERKLVREISVPEIGQLSPPHRERPGR